MPLMTITQKAKSVGRAVARRQPSPTPTGSVFSSAVMRNYPYPNRRPFPFGGDVELAAPRTPRRVMGDFSYGRSAPMDVLGISSPSSNAASPPWRAAGDPGNQTAGEVLQKSMKGRLFETSAGLVMAEGPGDYAEEYDFWSQGSVVDPHGNWMTVNDRSSAATVMDQSLQEYGGGTGMSGFAMDGLASYSDYEKNGIWALATDISNAAGTITNNWSHPEYLTTKNLSGALQNMGYPANEIAGLLAMSLSVLAIVNPNLAAKLRGGLPSTGGTQSGGTQPSNQGGTQPGTKPSFLSSIPMWAYPVFGIGAFLLIQRFRTARAA